MKIRIIEPKKWKCKHDILEISGRCIYIDLVRALYRLQWKIVKYFLCQDGQDKFPYFSRIPAHTLSLWFFILRKKNFFFSDLNIFEQKLVPSNCFIFVKRNTFFLWVGHFYEMQNTFPSDFIISWEQIRLPSVFIVYQKIFYYHLILSFLLKKIRPSDFYHLWENARYILTFQVELLLLT